VSAFFGRGRERGLGSPLRRGPATLESGPGYRPSKVQPQKEKVIPCKSQERRKSIAMWQREMRNITCLIMEQTGSTWAGRQGEFQKQSKNKKKKKKNEKKKNQKKKKTNQKKKKKPNTNTKKKEKQKTAIKPREQGRNPDQGGRPSGRLRGSSPPGAHRQRKRPTEQRGARCGLKKREQTSGIGTSCRV